MNCEDFKPAAGAGRLARGGFLLKETMIALAMALAMVVAVAQLLVAVGRQRLAAHQQSVAVREAGNLMEEIAARSWEETTAEALADLDLSESGHVALPEADLSVDVHEEGASVRRFRIQIRWEFFPDRPAAPVSLTGWKYGDSEEES